MLYGIGYKRKKYQWHNYEMIIPKLPVEEKYCLSNQIRKTSISITANIAGGYGPYYYHEGIQFYRIARGSLYELKDHLTKNFPRKSKSSSLSSFQ